MTFSMSLPNVFKRTIGQKALGESYDGFCGLGMIIDVDSLKWLGQ